MGRWAALCVVALGCAPPPPVGQGELDIGSSSSGDGYEAMPVQATLVPGAQGGFHVWLSYRVKVAEAGSFKASHTVRRESDGKLLSRGERKLEVGAPSDEGWWVSGEATPAFLCPTPLGVSVIDTQAVFEVTLTDADGQSVATASAKTQLVCPTDAQAEFCQRICKG